MLSDERTVARGVEGCTLVVGATPVGERSPAQPLAVLAEAAVATGTELSLEEARVAVLFGFEKTGLSNEELSHCHSVMTFPMQSYEGFRTPRGIWGQAAAVCLYELVRGRKAAGQKGRCEG